jgi:hypothetical protein
MRTFVDVMVKRKKREMASGKGILCWQIDMASSSASTAALADVGSRSPHK